MPPFRDRSRSRHRGPDQQPAAEQGDTDLASHDPELDSYLAALAPESDPGATALTGRFGSAQVFQLRMPAPRIEQLRRLAAERGVSPSAMAVEWVIDRLDREDTPTGPLPVVEEDQRRRPFRRRRRP
ncbi:hypothetical protein [Pseudonocardia asaccharolytica]|uniref:Uncharacterized protein n=1 Tax=Pseudonocardia asaccharolytica DSM 44247 = NBRC 16224 TaxID=1123024 RepID=A0A511CZH7_9PSEU|nr:hypothetical protein [Pseudonocardia asaccharolytica]GEL17952.1 hypothetical protein PA7_17890 [Pseudonocardia asaccharolytica DSM 44247 = NBRC 16224]